MDYRLTLTDVADEATRQAILAPLVEYNASQVGPSQHRPLAVLLTEPDGRVSGGLWGNTAYDWLYTQLLVVPAALRGRGIGARIMALAEGEARSRGCGGAWLDTFTFQARGFYERLGYVCFGELSHYPAGQARFFMQKKLGREGAIVAGRPAGTVPQR